MRRLEGIAEDAGFFWQAPRTYHKLGILVATHPASGVASPASSQVGARLRFG